MSIIYMVKEIELKVKVEEVKVLGVKVIEIFIENVGVVNSFFEVIYLCIIVEEKVDV